MAMTIRRQRSIKSLLVVIGVLLLAITTTTTRRTPNRRRRAVHAFSTTTTTTTTRRRHVTRTIATTILRHLKPSSSTGASEPRCMMMLRESDYDTIRQGKIAVIPNFIDAQEILALRTDAQTLFAASKFSTDALASYGSNGKFDPRKDRTVLKLDAWKNRDNGNWDTRRRLGHRLAALRADLATQLQRPQLVQGAAADATRFGNGSTEISYTRFGPGAYLKRHVDEHHEELKGRAGWLQPTRRSLSWLIYLNEDDWNPHQDGGQLRCFPRAAPTAMNAYPNLLGARPNGDLQMAWLRATARDPVERPVYLDCRHSDNSAGEHSVRMYILNSDDSSSRPLYITDHFDTNPILYVTGAETLVRRLLLQDRPDLASRFRFIEPPKSALGDWLASRRNPVPGQGQDPMDEDEVMADIDPLGGTLVLFDSVTLPHEVLATKRKDRWATSGWFHEDQPPPQIIS